MCLVEIFKVRAECSQTWSQMGGASLEGGLEEAHISRKRYLDASPEATSNTLTQFLVLSVEFPTPVFSSTRSDRVLRRWVPFPAEIQLEEPEAARRE